MTGKKGSYRPSNERLHTSSLRSPRGLVAWSMAIEPSWMNGRGIPPRTPHAQAFGKVFPFLFELFCLLARMATWPLALVGKIHNTCSCQKKMVVSKKKFVFLSPIELVVSNLTYLFISSLLSYFFIKGHFFNFFVLNFSLFKSFTLRI